MVKPLDPDELIARVRRHLPPQTRATEAPPGVILLTPREREVLRLLADGMDQREIAERLVISPKTVSTHIQHVLVKLGVHSRAQAVAAAHRYGLSEPRRVLGAAAPARDPRELADPGAPGVELAADVVDGDDAPDARET
jgi:DNA-binding CsgD family transcriptional regulator